MKELQKLIEQGAETGAYSCAAYEIGTSAGSLARGYAGRLGIGRGEASQETLYELASVTKPIVAVGFMRLLEQGRICLDDTVDRFLPAYRGYPKGSVSMYALLTHTSTVHGQVQLYHTCHSKEDMLLAVRSMPPRSLTPLSVEYSSQGFMLIGEAVAAAAGMPLDQALATLVLEPLEMRNTCFNPPEALHARIASTEDCPWRGRMVVGQVHDENAVVMGGVAGHAGLFSDTQDLAKLCRAMLTGLAPDGARFLQPATLALMTRCHTAGLNLARGLGWQMKDPQGSPAGDLFSAASFGHTGFTGTSLWMDPTRDLYAVLLTNRVHPSRESNEIQHIRHVFHNLSALYADACARKAR